MTNLFDVLIIGGGSAGLTSAIYAKRYGLETLVISDSFGGMMSTAHKICNYPGFLEITGMELSQKVMEQVTNLDVEIVFEKVVDIVKSENGFIVNTDQRTVRAKKIILAIGRARRKLNLPREEELTGKGVSYCATCDAGFYRGKEVGVIGGSDAAVTAALMLLELASKVYLIYRGPKLRAEQAWVDLALKNPNLEVLYNTEVVDLLGEEKLEGVKTNTDKEISLEGLFIEIGSVPNTELLKKLDLSLDDKNFIKVDRDQRTNIPGIFAVGDATNATDLKQVITAASQGAVAAYFAYLDVRK